MRKYKLTCFYITLPLQKMEDTERSNAELSKQKVDLQSLPTQVYLDQTVVIVIPTLMKSLIVLLVLFDD
uniref:Uncharacterized protein n=1 Tax=Oncorhynchus mykiss TaxID=8022 RepID=A0A8C7PDN1_ONCMY